LTSDEDDGWFSKPADLRMVDGVANSALSGSPQDPELPEREPSKAKGSAASAAQAALRLAVNAVATSSSVAAAEVSHSGLPAADAAAGPHRADADAVDAAEDVWLSPPRGRQSLRRFRDWKRTRRLEKEWTRSHRSDASTQLSATPRFAAARAVLVTSGEGQLEPNRLSPAFAESYEIQRALLTCDNIMSLKHVALKLLDAMVACELGTVNMATCIHRTAMFWLDLQSEVASLDAQGDQRNLAELVQQQRTRVRSAYFPQL
jgi:hypothetical protein